MSLPKFNPRTAVLLLFILIIGAVRVGLNMDKSLFVLSNFSPLGAMALFGGAYFNKQWKALSFPLLTLLASDLILSFSVFNNFRSGLLYGGWYWTYAAFILMTLAGRGLIRKVNLFSLTLASFVCVLIHWMVTDWGVWLHSIMYAKTVAGFVACLTAAIPFEIRFFTGTFIYGSLMFVSFEGMQRQYPALQKQVN